MSKASRRANAKVKNTKAERLTFSIKYFSLPIRSSLLREKMERNRDNGNHQFSQPNPPHIGTSKAPGVSLNVHLTVPPTTTAAQDGSHTPNTPEILNSIVKLQAEREEAREALASSGPFGAEFARQCAIRSTPIPAMSLPNELSTEEAVPVKPISSGYNQIEVITKELSEHIN